MGVTIALVTALAVAGTANAQPSAQQDARDAEARSLFEAGRAAYASGRFDEALDRFRAAYRLSPRPALLYNIGQAADRLRRDREALDAYEQFLAAEPDSTAAPVARERIGFLRRQIDRTDDAVGDQQADESHSGGPRVLTADTRPSDGGGSALTSQWWFWTGVGAVVVAAIVVTIVLSSGTSTQDPITGDIGSGGVVVALGAP